ncbi:MAG TPA: hypothetical protein VFG74_00635 [Miltoncostaeaceae bacterium]|nr:hypothetical protein [Miltoncostaeaceae bacterium]
MAKRKKRKSAGPPPVTGPKRPSAVAAAEEAAAKPEVQKRKPGEPVPPSFRGVLLRAGIVAALFYPYLIYAVGEDPGPAFLLSVIALAFMIPLGLWLDRFRYKRQLRRWEQRRAARTPGR